MRNKIINYIRAGYPGLYLVSHEEQRVALEMTRIAQELKYNLVFWSVVDGLVDTQKGTNNSANDPVHGELPFKQRLAVQTIRGSGFASGNSQGWRVEGLGRPLSPRACRRIALGVHAPRCRTF